MSNQSSPGNPPVGREDADSDVTGDQASDDHLADVDDGCGCVEVWEHLSDQRTSNI